MSEAEEKLNELLTQDEIYDIGKQFYKNFSIIDKLPELPEFLIAQIAKLKEAGYLPVEPVQLEMLSPAEITDAKQEAERLSWEHRPHPIYEKDIHLLQVNNAKNEAKFGQFYRRRE